MDVAKQRELVDALLACPSMDSQQRRDAVVDEVRGRIPNMNIDRSAADRDDIAAIVRTCLKFPNGLEELVAAVRVRDQGSFPLQNLDRLILRLFSFDLDQEETGLRLLAILSGVQSSADQLQRAYERLLPPGVSAPPGTTGLFSMLPHLWQVSRELAAQSRGGSVPILDFIEQLARDASGSVAGQLRAWATEITSWFTMGLAPGKGGPVFSGSGTGTGDGGTGGTSTLDPRLTILASVLAALCPTIEASGELVAAARLNPVGIEFRELPAANWHNILTAAARRDRVGQLITAALAADPDNAWLKVAQAEETRVRETRQRQAARPTPDDTGSLERVLQATTAWPQHIVFLQDALARSRPVVRVQRADGGLSTGFLLRDNLLVVPSYVIGSPEEARKTVIQLNLERTTGELITTPVEFGLAPDEGFAVSKENMWAAVRVARSADERWSYLDLAPAAPQVNDSVSLIYHPGGGPKQVELLNRTITYVDTQRVQYSIWSKQPGSSGAPVFDANWRVVGMHSAAGNLPTPGSNETAWRGEAVHINVIIDGLQAAGLYVGKEGT